MKPKEVIGLIKRIYQELDEIQIVISRIHAGWEHASQSNDDLYLDSVALNLHGFYSGFERVFGQIAEIIDGDMPGGENWHELLLTQMTKEIPKIRPAVISNETRRLLDELRRFRHVVRNVYTHTFNPRGIEKLIDYADHALEKLRAELSAFADFLEKA